MKHYLMPAIFLDKDGTLIRDVPYNVDPDQIELMPHAGRGLAVLAEAGFPLVVISNQSGVARGLFEESALVTVEQRIRELLADYGVPLAGFYYCPHHELGSVAQYRIECRCRKPQPGMLLDAAHDLRIDLNRSWVIGDILDDVEAGHWAGARSILIDNGHETLWRWNPRRRPDYVASDLTTAADFILAAMANAGADLEVVA
jgi:D-glycero-D-manno-heptose 1,7-bisphosphate phosphatase